MDITGVPVNQKTNETPWFVSDSKAGAFDKFIATKLSSIMFSDGNIFLLQKQLRESIYSLKGIDIRMQDSSSIYNELYAWYKNLKYNNVNYTDAQAMEMAKKLNDSFMRNKLIPAVLMNLSDKELYDSWALKVPDPLPKAETENNYDKSVSMFEYYDKSIGSGDYSNNSWRWGENSGMYDEPDSLYARYPTTSYNVKNNRKYTHPVVEDSRFL